MTLTARLLAVADIYEAMTARRPYRGPLSLAQVLVALDSDAGSTLDSDCVAALHAWVEIGLG